MEAVDLLDGVSQDDDELGLWVELENPGHRCSGIQVPRAAFANRRVSRVGTVKAGEVIFEDLDVSVILEIESEIAGPLGVGEEDVRMSPEIAAERGRPALRPADEERVGFQVEDLDLGGRTVRRGADSRLLR